MKKNIFLVLLLLLTVVCAYGQNASPIDLILLLDTSSTMSSSYENVNNYITGDFLNEFLRVGDTFHLIAFSSNSRLDVARRISGVGDVETIIGRMLLQYPIENGSNISSALSYAEQYITTLPARQKKIVLVSVGSSDTGNLVNASKQRLSSKNSTLDFIQVTPGKTLSNLPKSGRPAGAKITTTTTTTTKPASSGGTQGVSSGPSGQTQSKTNSGTGTTGGTTGAGSGAAAAGTTAKTGVGGATAGTGTTTGTSATGASAGTGATTGTSATGASAGTGTTTGTSATGASAGTGATTGTSAAGPSSVTIDISPTGTVTVQENNLSVQGQNAVSGTNADKQPAGNSPNADNSSSGGKKAKNNLSAEEKAKNGTESYHISLPFILLVSILALLLLGIIIFFASRKLGSSPNRVMSEAASAGGKTPRDNTKDNPKRDITKDNPKRDIIKDNPKRDIIKHDTIKRDNIKHDNIKRDNTKFADNSKELAKYASVPNRRSSPYDVHPLKPDTHKPPVINPSGPLLLNLFVEDQNTAIGKRNIHSLKSGYSLTVGGGKTDDYMIFLVPIPPHIGEIHRSGSSLTFIPRKPKYFPDIGANEVRDCINKTIRIISDKQFEMRFRFEMYEDPLIALNRVLMSVKIPG